MELIKGLNDRQKEAVLHTEGPLLILAGAGSGKTRVLTHRIAYLVEEKGIFPGNILAITFTNKAANEMKERVDNLLDGNIDDIWMGTFHSVCVRILRRNIDKIGYDRSFSIYDRDDQITVVKECIKDLNLSKDMYKERSVLSVISSLKDKMTEPDTYINQNYSDYYSRNVGEIYALYEKKLKANNALDFDDLIIKTVELLKSNPDVLDYYQKKFKYIFVDEFQDTNKIQYKLVKLISERYRNICVVGDDDQSIYGWRGADISNILDFEKDFPNTKIIKLEQNYRSTKNILNVANHVIKNNSSRKEKKLWTDNEEGNQVVVESLLDSEEEAYFVANKVEELIKEGYKPSDFAILYRTNAQSRTFEEIFMRKSIPYKIVGGLRFYDRKEIKDIIAYLKLIQNPVDDISLKRIINVPKRGIGNATLEKIEEYANEAGESIYSTLLNVEKVPNLSTRAKNNLKSFVDMINKFMAMSEVMGLKEFLEEVVYGIGYIKELEEEASIEAQTRLDNIKEFISVAIDFEVRYPEGSLEDFLATISLLSDVDKTEDIDNSVTLLTVHSAKGLEFPIVFMVGMEEGLFPISRALDDETELEEERRLCYVAITRAEKSLFITHAKLRTIYGNTNYSLPSRFISEIPEGYTASSMDRGRIKASDYKKQLVKVHDYTKGINRAIYQSNNNNTDVDLGDKVSHKKWGVGTIVQIKERDDDKEIVIAFDKVGLKRLLLSIAPIEILKGE
ncbi:DNA helicase PcrA [Clostridium sp. Cult1]|uniref:DNA helicase PcrA n=1 Tax=Clostridium sp. Cult1 TaxID=2079002 RepID=UPI001F02C22A|nr:DNA helicase PcrA [Clostridium sp. Cult1]MCF6462939.1 DNA helicase PcrA [Clostridium sp. Cult1]